MSKFVIREVSSGFKFDLKATNGQTILSSEVYTTRAALRKGLESVRRSVSAAKLEDQTLDSWRPLTNPKFELYRDNAGEFRFRLKARNGQIIGTSEGYAAKAGCLGGIESVMNNAAEAQIEE